MATSFALGHGGNMRNLTIVFHDAGGGHRNAALALKAVLEEQDYPWNVRLVNLQELLEPIDLVHRATGHRLQDGYNLLLRKGWTRLTPQLLVLLQCTIRLHHPRIVRILRDYLGQEFHRSGSLGDSAFQRLPGAKAFARKFLMRPSSPCSPIWLTIRRISGSSASRNTSCAAASGRGSRRWPWDTPPIGYFKTSGMVLKPSFYRRPRIDREQERIRLGLQPNRPTGIVMFGGHGSASMLDIAKQMDRHAGQVQLIFLCGHNVELAAKIRNLRLKMPVAVEEFTTQVDYFMSVADFFIGKAGPGSISEALQFGLPVIVERNARTMPQERYNATWLTEQRLGIVVPGLRRYRDGHRAVDCERGAPRIAGQRQPLRESCDF